MLTAHTRTHMHTTATIVFTHVYCLSLAHQSFTMTNLCEKNLQVRIFLPLQIVSWSLFYLFFFSSIYSCEQLVNIGGGGGEQEPRLGEVNRGAGSGG